MTNKSNLVIFSAQSAMTVNNDNVFSLTLKFVDGVKKYAEFWPGTVSVWVQRGHKSDNNLDHIEIHSDDLPFLLNWMEVSDPSKYYPGLDEADIVLATLMPDHLCLAELCAERNIPLIYITELSMETRRQIVRAETRNPFLRWRRERWAQNIEKHYLNVIKMASGIQCNGLPTFTTYRNLNKHSLLFFDSRVNSNQLIEAEKLDRRLLAMHELNPLRLGFSGRLIAIKGVDHLPNVAHELMRLNVPFTMDICGNGELEPLIRMKIKHYSLESKIRIRGVLDFESELLPFISDNIDLFVSCHRQGDPSCTYIETYSCGVPIIGYANEAFIGLAELSDVGGTSWVTPMDDPITLARKIADLNIKREKIEIASRKALAFAALHTFENTISSRVQHLIECQMSHSNKYQAYN